MVRVEAPLARAALLGEPVGRVLGRLSHADIAPFVRALESSGQDGPLAGALNYALGAGRDATLRDAIHLSVYEVTDGHPSLNSKEA